MIGSSWTGQRALQPLPPKSISSKRTIASYNLPESLIQPPPSTLSSSSGNTKQQDYGLPVLKVTKNGKLQTRRLAFTPDRRHILVTTNRFNKHTPGRLFKGLLSTIKKTATPNKKSKNNNSNDSNANKEASINSQQPEQHLHSSDDAENSSLFLSSADLESYHHNKQSMKLISLATIDRVQRGSGQSHRFTLARQEAAAERDGQAVLELLDGNNACLSIVYYTTNSANEQQSTVGMHSGGLALSNSSNNSGDMGPDSPSCRLETLDLVIPHETDFEVLLAVLESLVVLHTEERQRYSSNLLALNARLVDMGKGWHADLSLPEFLNLCDRFQMPLSKSECQAMFKQESVAKQNNNQRQLSSSGASPQRRQEDVRLSYAVVVNLLETMRARSVLLEKNPLERLWKELVSTDPVPPVGWQGGTDEATVELNIQTKSDSISAVAFLSFLRSQQKEYSTTLEEAIELIHILDHVLVPEDLLGKASRTDQQADRLSKNRFFAFLMADANDLLHPARGRIACDDMTRPLCQYWINTSHDTYLAPIVSSMHGKNAYLRYGKSGHVVVDEQAYTAALLRGVRCLELDVWDSWDGRNPVLSRCGLRTSSDQFILFETVVRAIRSFLDQQPYTYPIILKIENHCSFAVQGRMANLLQDILGSAGLIVQPSCPLDDGEPILPSPESIRGKVLIIGKRPLVVGPGRTVRRDDFDVDIDLKKHLHDEFNEDTNDDNDPRVIIGFNELGPIRSADPDEMAQPPAELYRIAENKAEHASNEAKQADFRAKQLLKQAEELENRSNGLIQASGLSAAEIKRQTELASSTGLSTPDAMIDMVAIEEDSNMDEGLEVHEVLPEMVNASRSSYEHAANLAMDAAGLEAQCHMMLRDMEESFRMAKANLDMSQAQEKLVLENARRAAAEARTYHEHAMSATARLEKVRELLGTSKDQSSSAGNVVQTALTEAKISEKRAADAEAKARRAAVAAENERVRADAETKKEEILEHDVNELHHDCMQSTEAAKTCRDRVDKAASMLDRLNEQIKLIERSSQFRKEQQDVNVVTCPADGSFMEKHTTKLRERVKCEMLINEARQENSAAEMRRNRLQQAFEEKAYLWKMQAEVAAQTRKAADRSAHVAEDLAEDAAEEREAANLRHIARQRAEATVENRGSYLQSFETQLSEADKAAKEASAAAAQSKKKAEHLEKEVVKVKDHTRFLHAVELAGANRKKAHEEFENAKVAREIADNAMMEEKRRLDTSADVYESAARTVASEADRKKIELIYQQEAVVSYNQAVTTRERAEQAVQALAAAISKAEIMRRAANAALKYKQFMENTAAIPVDLAKLTFFHSCKFQRWGKSLSLPNVYMHSTTHNILLLKVDKEAEEEKSNLNAFTRTNLYRVVPSWREIHRKPCSNYDPVFAWALGCQLVSTNFHSTDENLLIAEGRFRQNGSCGYALKPSHLTDNEPHAEHEQKWTFSILGGFNLPKPGKASPVINPIVKVSMYSGSTKEMRISYRTKPAMRNGMNPVWTSHNKFSFTIPTPSVSMLAFSVWHTTDDALEHFIAAAAFPAGSVREGYRSIALFDGNHTRLGQFSAAGLIVKATRR